MFADPTTVMLGAGGTIFAADYWVAGGLRGATVAGDLAAEEVLAAS